MLYLNVSDVEYMDFVTRFNMPDEFMSWFLITELHAWMLMVRTADEDVHPMGLRDGVNRMLWTDTIARLKPLQQDRTKMHDWLEEVGAQTRYATLSYDEGLEDDKVLASALWHRFFQKECEDYEQLALMLKYVRINVSAWSRVLVDIRWPTCFPLYSTDSGIGQNEHRRIRDGTDGQLGDAGPM